MAKIFGRIFNRGEPDCPEVRNLGSDFLEDGLTSQKRSTVQAHLDKCPPCRAFIETLSATIGLLTRIPRTNPPQSFKEKIFERINREEKDRR